MFLTNQIIFINFGAHIHKSQFVDPYRHFIRVEIKSDFVLGQHKIKFLFSCENTRVRWRWMDFLFLNIHISVDQRPKSPGI